MKYSEKYIKGLNGLLLLITYENGNLKIIPNSDAVLLSPLNCLELIDLLKEISEQD